MRFRPRPEANSSGDHVFHFWLENISEPQQNSSALFLSPKLRSKKSSHKLHVSLGVGVGYSRPMFLMSQFFGFLLRTWTGRLQSGLECLLNARLVSKTRNKLVGSNSQNELLHATTIQEASLPKELETSHATVTPTSVKNYLRCETHVGSRHDRVHLFCG